MTGRTFRFVAWILAWLGRERVDISTGTDEGNPYLTRWTLLGRRTEGRTRLFLHYFHRSDYARAFHDHPWPFVSLILWPGYFENTPFEIVPAAIEVWSAPAGTPFPGVHDTPSSGWARVATARASHVRRWYGPLSILSRPAEWKHWVEIPKGAHCWTLVWTGEKTRSWGFHCHEGNTPGQSGRYVPWREFVEREQAGKDGCGA